MKRHLHLHLNRYRSYPPMSVYRDQVSAGYSLIIDSYCHLRAIFKRYQDPKKPDRIKNISKDKWTPINVYWLQALYGISCIKRVNLKTMLKHHFSFYKLANRFAIVGMLQMMRLPLMVIDLKYILYNFGINNYPYDAPVPNQFTEQHAHEIYQFTHRYYTPKINEEVIQ